MTTDRDFDGIAKAWLADGPEELPDRVLFAVVDDIRHARQRHARRMPWRFPTMSFTARTSAFLVIGALVAVGGVAVLGGVSGQGAPPPTPTPSAEPPSAAPSAADGNFAIPVLSQRFSSTLNGFSIAYPAGWSAVPGTTPWRQGTLLIWGDPALDVIKTDDVRLVVATQHLAPEQTPTDWFQANCRIDPAGQAPCAALPGAWEEVTVDGVTGYRDGNGQHPPVQGVAPDGVIYSAEVVTGGHAYQFAMDGHVDRAMFDAFLATVKLPAIPALDRTYTSALAGYSIDYPADWTVTAATKPWTKGYETKSYSDNIGGHSGGASIDGTSMKLPAGTSFETWFAAYDADRVLGTCGAPSRNQDITVDGVVGHLDVHCPTMYVEAVIAKGGRVYVFTMFQPFSRQLFESLLDTVRLTPETAAP